jgi:hypothetical protein
VIGFQKFYGFEIITIAEYDNFIKTHTQLNTLHSTQNDEVSTNVNFTSNERILNLPLPEVGSCVVVAKRLVNKKTGVRTAVIYLHQFTPILYDALQVSALAR